MWYLSKGWKTAHFVAGRNLEKSLYGITRCGLNLPYRALVNDAAKRCKLCVRVLNSEAERVQHTVQESRARRGHNGFRNVGVPGTGHFARPVGGIPKAAGPSESGLEGIGRRVDDQGRHYPKPGPLMMTLPAPCCGCACTACHSGNCCKNFENDSAPIKG